LNLADIDLVASQFPGAEKKNGDVSMVTFPEGAVGIDVNHPKLQAESGGKRFDLRQGFFAQVAAGAAEQGQIGWSGDLDTPGLGSLVLPYVFAEIIRFDQTGQRRLGRGAVSRGWDQVGRGEPRQSQPVERLQDIPGGLFDWRSVDAAGFHFSSAKIGTPESFGKPLPEAAPDGGAARRTVVAR